MIDFRYHLVSLVSVFLALAVGVVLGAGPLRGQIADSLSNSVEQLRAEKDLLRTERDVAEAGVKNRETFTKQLTPVVVANRLPGRSVVLVTLPDSDGDAVEPLTKTLQAAGAVVTGRVDLKPAWIVADKAADRRELAQTWAGVLTTPSLPVPSASPTPSAPAGQAPSKGGTDSEAVLAALLARTLVTLNPLEVSRADPVGRQVLDAFAKKGLLSVRGDLTRRANQVVVLAPGVDQALAGAPTPSPSPSADPSPAWAELVLTLDGASNGAVLLGPASAATAGGVLAAVRGNSVAVRQVSTVDTGGSPMGDLTVVLALREQGGGTAGSYGFGKGAAAPLPTAVVDAAARGPAS
ncbi:MAG: copper transporter [Kineosporiaceae bacterium]